MNSNSNRSVGMLGSRPARIAIDVALLVGFVIEFVTREGPDYGFHSWVGIVLIPVIAVHLVGNWRWIRSAARRLAEHPEWKLARFNALFGIVTTVCVLTGFAPWLDWPGADPMGVVHNVTGLAALVLMFSHLWRNRRRIRTLARRRTS